MLSGRSSPLESDFLNQIRVVYLGQKIPIFVNATTSVTLTVKQVSNDATANFGWIDDHAQIEIRTISGKKVDKKEPEPIDLKFSLNFNKNLKKDNLFELLNLTLSGGDNNEEWSLTQTKIEGVPFVPVFVQKNIFEENLEIVPSPALILSQFELLGKNQTEIIQQFNNLVVEFPKKEVKGYNFLTVRDLKIEIGSDFHQIDFIKSKFVSDFADFRSNFPQMPILLKLNFWFGTSSNFQFRFSSKNAIENPYLILDPSIFPIIEEFRNFLENSENYTLLNNGFFQDKNPISWNLSSPKLAELLNRYKFLESGGFTSFMPVSVQGNPGSGKTTFCQMASLYLNRPTVAINISKMLIGGDQEWAKIDKKITDSVKACLDKNSITIILDGTNDIIVSESSDGSKPAKRKIFAYFEAWD